MLCSFDKFVETEETRATIPKSFLTNLDARHCVLSRATFAYIFLSSRHRAISKLVRARSKN